LRVLLQESRCGFADSLLFANVNAFGGAAKLRCASKADLDKYQRVLVKHDQVDLAAGRTVVSLHGLEPLSL